MSRQTYPKILKTPEILQKDLTYPSPAMQKQGQNRLLILNINGCRDKSQELEYVINYIKPNIILLNETKITQKIKNSEILPSNFQASCFIKDRTNHGGGVLLAVIDGLACTQLDVKFENN